MRDFTPPPCSPRRQRCADAAPNDITLAVSKEIAPQAYAQSPGRSVNEHVEQAYCASPLYETPAPCRVQTLMRRHGDALDVLWCEQDLGAEDEYPCKNTFVHFQDPPATRARSPRTEPRSFKPEAWDRWPSTPEAVFATPSTGVLAMGVVPLVLAGVEGSPCVIGRVAPALGGAQLAVPAMVALHGLPEPTSRASDPTTLRLADLLFP